MCGITGQVANAPSAGEHAGAATDREIVRRMMLRATHRGPDDTGTYDDGLCAFGHTRLSIIDREGGHEPILDDEGRALIYNGEIYNHETLRAGLESRGRRFTTRSDAEVPLHALTDAGVFDAPHVDAMMERAAAVVDTFDGMFAFVVWDPANRRLFAARDAYGIKPFFWATHPDDHTFRFASEMKSLLADPTFPAALDHDALREKLVFEYLLPGRTWLLGIRELAPGHMLVHDARTGQTTTRRWFHERAATGVPTDPEALGERLHRLLVAAVEKRLMSERPLGVVLSGGLDSSLIAAIDRDLDPDRSVSTFSVADDTSNVDYVKSRLVADALGTDHKEWLFDREDFDRDSAEMVWHTEDIDHTTYFFYPLFRHMSEHAVVGLCGQGADEAFGGYDRYKDLPGLRSGLTARARDAWHERHPERSAEVRRTIEHQYADLRSTLAWERGPQLQQFQLRLVDRNSMAFGTEIRVPFLDKAVVAHAAALPDPLLIDEDGLEKKALRLAARRTSLPEEIVLRKKRPAGRRTSPGVVDGFERDAAAFVSKLPRPKADLERLGLDTAASQRLIDPAQHVMVRLFEEVFVHGRGTRPKGFAWNDLA